MSLLTHILFLSLFHISYGIGEDDLVNPVPGLIFESKFKTYSGYLNGNDNGTWKMHYMLTESKSNPDTDPVLLWMNGGPGCSSFSGGFEELGPYYINSDNKTLFENVYAWNQKANVLYLESPIGTGFSYSTDDVNYDVANDDQTLQQNIHALTDFFKRVQPKYINRTFFISGESYAGIYLPMIGDALITLINNNSFPNPNFGGIAIGNGYMDIPKLQNSLVLWSEYHGRFSIDTWNSIKTECCNNNDVDKCNFYQHFNSTTQLDFYPANTKCGSLLAPIMNASSLFNIDPYNYYQECYNGAFITYFDGRPNVKVSQRSLDNHYMKNRNVKTIVNPNYPYSNNSALLINKDSTDVLFGYPCWQETFVAGYFNDPDVQAAYHIDPIWAKKGKVFSDCNNDLYSKYKVTYLTMATQFNNMIKNNKNPNFRILVYNGDVDTVCNYLGDSWFIDEVSTNNKFGKNNRTRWYYRNEVGGFVQTYNNTNMKIHVLTVRGAGHMVPMDRQGQSLQMITNFMNDVDFSSDKLINTNPVPAPLLQGKNGKNSFYNANRSIIFIALFYIIYRFM
uniref:Carboxypeptidase n=1 Tax=Parastrongyloides trichosuri TaxID=131310 RepID=A0A0N4ZC93_PARTI